MRLAGARSRLASSSASCVLCRLGRRHHGVHLVLGDLLDRRRLGDDLLREVERHPRLALVVVPLDPLLDHGAEHGTVVDQLAEALPGSAAAARQSETASTLVAWSVARSSERSPKKSPLRR